MRDLIKNEIIKYVSESKENWFEEIDDHYYDEPVIKFTSADEPLFAEYKKIIGNYHLTPGEAFEKKNGYCFVLLEMKYLFGGLSSISKVV